MVKQFGVGLSTAVLLAATMVLMLAPAVLTLLGRWAWWMPAWLGRIVPTVDIEGTSLGGDNGAGAGRAAAARTGLGARCRQPAHLREAPGRRPHSGIPGWSIV